jgi:5-methyltetrahydropteroyltriglutamate--homocysteine methyltransferase
MTEALLPIVNREMKALAEAGVDFLQLDEPSFACHPDEPDRFLDIIARTVDGVKAKISMHLCFGNYRGRAVGWRSYKPLFPHLAKAKVNQLALEFASREMSEIELARQIAAPMELAVGLVDVKNTWVEPPELVADHLRQVLKHIEPERVHVTPDCGFSQTARHVAIKKLTNMVEGVRILRRELSR